MFQIIINIICGLTILFVVLLMVASVVKYIKGLMLDKKNMSYIREVQDKEKKNINDVYHIDTKEFDTYTVKRYTMNNKYFSEFSKVANSLYNRDNGSFRDYLEETSFLSIVDNEGLGIEIFILLGRKLHKINNSIDSGLDLDFSTHHHNVFGHSFKKKIEKSDKENLFIYKTMIGEPFENMTKKDFENYFSYYVSFFKSKQENMKTGISLAEFKEQNEKLIQSKGMFLK